MLNEHRPKFVPRLENFSLRQLLARLLPFQGDVDFLLSSSHGYVADAITHDNSSTGYNRERLRWYVKCERYFTRISNHNGEAPAVRCNLR
jgi:hypothetical protein